MITLYGINTCDTCRRARRWLQANDVDYRFHDLRADGLTRAQLDHWVRNTGWEALLNRRSSTWRTLPEDRRRNLDEHDAIQLMEEYPTLVKRPVLEAGDDVEIGFSESRYRELLR